jgi:hypothetical protein
MRRTCSTIIASAFSRCSFLIFGPWPYQHSEQTYSRRRMVDVAASCPTVGAFSLSLGCRSNGIDRQTPTKIPQLKHQLFQPLLLLHFLQLERLRIYYACTPKQQEQQTKGDEADTQEASRLCSEAQTRCSWLRAVEQPRVSQNGGTK